MISHPMVVRPNSPIDPDSLLPASSASSEGRQARLTCILRKPRKRGSHSFAKAEYNFPYDVGEPLPKGGVLAGCGSFFGLEWRATAADRWRAGDWILLPYVHPVNSDVRTAFRKAIMSELNNPDVSAFSGELLRKLKSDRKKLVSLYNDHFEVGQNAISMSLYSGPYSGRHKSFPSTEIDSLWALGFGQMPSPVGWLSTGDSKLKQTARRKPWLDFFNRYSDEILILSLPHHGSAKDFHEEILNFNGLQFAVATTVLDRHRVFGLEDTLARVKSAGKQHRVVDDKAESEFDIMCRRSMSRRKFQT